MNSGCFPFFSAISVASSVAATTWSSVPLERLVEQNPVIVTGTIEKTAPILSDARSYPERFIADFRISIVLKNELADPEVTEGGNLLLAISNFDQLLVPGPHHRKGASALWLLSPRMSASNDGSRHYYGSHPDQRQPMSAAIRIAQIIAQQAIEQGEAYAAAQMDIERHRANRESVPRYSIKDFEADQGKTIDENVDVAQLRHARISNREGAVGYVFLDQNGKVHLATRYHVGGRFSEGLAAVSTAVGQHSVLIRDGFIDRKGQVVFDPKFDEVRRFSEGLAWVRLRKKWGAVDKTGKVVIPMNYDQVLDPGIFRDGVAQVKQGPWILLIDRTGSVLAKVETSYRWTRWSDGLYPVHHQESNYEIVDSRGRTVFTINADSAGFEIAEIRRFQNGFAPIRELSYGPEYYSLIDISGRVLFEPRFLECGQFSEGLIPVMTDKPDLDRCWGYVDETGKLVIASSHRWADAFSEGLAAVKTLTWVPNPYKPGGIIRQMRYGFVDRTGALVIPAWFDRARRFIGGMAFVDDGADQGFIDKSGRYIWRTLD